MNPVQSADIFCRVIDNFGDAGVCWRLSRALARAGLSVTLWIDDLARLQRLRPQLVLSRQDQMLDGFRVRLWDDAAPVAYEPAQLVIEAFACRMPAAMIERMADTLPRPAWINLDYLTAESWARETHGLPSPHPRLPLTQYFFFPGFAPGSGGLLREADIATRHGALDEQGREAFLVGVGVSVPRDALLVSLFCYPQAPLQALLESMRHGPRVLCLISEGVASEAISRITGVSAAPGTVLTLDQLTLHVIPFLEPDDYDSLLRFCDLNFVRGEDSLVRAHWAERPFIWQLYPQQDDAHQDKMQAFLTDFCVGLNSADEFCIRNFWQAWNSGIPALLDWAALCEALPRLTKHYRLWSAKVAAAGELSRAIVEFAAKIR